MNDLDTIISPLVQKQFPGFYEEEGPLFILFTTEYFKWLETKELITSGTNIAGQSLFYSRSILTYSDVDKTIEDFLVYFSQKYLQGIDFNIASNKRTLIKGANDLYKSKGTPRSVDLLFRLVFGTRVEVFLPGDNILKPSDGTWVVPQYLELTASTRTKSLIGKQITGSKSGAIGFIEYVITRNIKGKIIDIAYLSNAQGTFSTGDIITEDGIIENAPKVSGSLTTLSLTTNGQDFSVGEEVYLTSARGTEGIARVTGIVSETGKVQFSLVNGGWGYSTTANTMLSSKVFFTSNTRNSNSSITTFEEFEPVQQDILNLTVNNFTQSFSVGELVYNPNANAGIVNYVNQIAGSNTANVYVTPINGANLVANSIIFSSNQAVIVTETTTFFEAGKKIYQQISGSNSTTTGVITSVSNAVLLVINATSISANGLHVGTYIKQNTTQASGVVRVIPKESNFAATNVNIIAVTSTTGTFNNTNVLTAYSDPDFTVQLATATPTYTSNGYVYTVGEVTSSNSTFANRNWNTSSVAVSLAEPTTNVNISIASDVGGKLELYTDISATATVIGSNTSALGVININNTFYGNPNTIVRGTFSNTYANLTSISTGVGANFNIGIVDNSETVRLSPDTIYSNNDGLGSNSVRFASMLIAGANSTYGNMSSVFISSGGSGYSNTNKVTFSGGNTGVSSYGAANATIITDASGVIAAVGLSVNVGAGYITSPTVSIVNATGGSTGVGTGANLVPSFHLGFVKNPMGDINTPLLDLLRFETLTIGSIATLTGINPGENYNVDPFVLAIEPYVAAYGKRDFIISAYSTSNTPPPVIGEYVVQTSEVPATSIVSNTYSGNTNNVYEVSEVVYSTDGVSNVAVGTLYSSAFSIGANGFTSVVTDVVGSFQNTVNTTILTVSTNTSFSPGSKITQGTANGILITSNTSRLVVSSVLGTFQVNATAVSSNTGGTATVSAVANTRVYTLIGSTSKMVSSINSVSACTASALAKGIVGSYSSVTSNATHITYSINVKRRSLFTEYYVDNTYHLIGTTSGANLTITSVTDDMLSDVTGFNAVITANVVTSEGSLSNLSVIDSGFGYVQDESVTITSADGTRTATAKANILEQGKSAGYYTTTRGFLDNNKYIHDGDYYQEYSYHLNSTLPFNPYSDILKQIVHVAGTKLFGSLVRVSDVVVQNTETAVSYITTS